MVVGYYNSNINNNTSPCPLEWGSSGDGGGGPLRDLDRSCILCVCVTMINNSQQKAIIAKRAILRILFALG